MVSSNDFFLLRIPQFLSVCVYMQTFMYIFSINLFDDFYWLVYKNLDYFI